MKTLVFAANESRADWDAEVQRERQRQLALGYDAEHDREHGADHLLRWAATYLYRGETLKAAAMMEALRDLLASAHCSPPVVNVMLTPSQEGGSITPPVPPAAGAATMAATVSPSINVHIDNRHAIDPTIPHHLLNRRGRLVSSHL